MRVTAADLAGIKFRPRMRRCIPHLYKKRALLNNKHTRQKKAVTLICVQLCTVRPHRCDKIILKTKIYWGVANLGDTNGGGDPGHI